MTKKILSIVFSLVFMFVLAFSISWGVINFNKVRTGMASTGVYTNEDLTKSYEDGYDNALKDKAEYTATIAECRDTITSLNDKISQLNFQITNLNENNQEYKEQIGILSRQKENLESQVVNLQTAKNENEITIRNLDNQIIGLQNTVSQLETNKEQNAVTISELNAQIANLQSINSQLQITNQINADTITSLNSQIVSLNNQVHEMSEISQNAGSQIAALTNRVNELQASVSYYESYIATMENSEQVVATYEVNGSVWKLEIVNKGAEITLSKPADTDTLIINGWKVNGQGSIISETYTLNSNTKFVADVTHKYVVQFMNDAQIHDKQFIVENKSAALPIPPVKDGYEFVGWSLNGIDIVDNITSNEVTENTTYFAVYVKLHSVTFIIENEVVATQIVKNNCYADDSNVSHESTGEFEHWQVNEVTVDLSNYPILADTVFIAEINYNDWVDTYFIGGSNFDAQYIWSDGTDIYYSYSSAQFKLDKGTKTWTRMLWQGYQYPDGDDIWTDGTTYYYSDGSDHYVLDNATKTWSKITWTGLTNFHGASVWTDGEDIFYSDWNNSGKQYELNLKKKNWTSVSWSNNNIYGSSIWTNGELYFATAYGNAYQYVYTRATHNWRSVTWKGAPSSDERVTAWTDGENYYYTRYTGETYLVNFDDYSLTLLEDWTSPKEQFYARYTWTDGENYYYSEGSYQYVLDKTTLTWQDMQWTGGICLTSGAGDIGPYIWTDGDRIYYSRIDNFVLDVETHTWSKQKWNISVNPQYIWTDGENIYHSDMSRHYVLDKTTQTWVETEWTGIRALYGSGVWAIDGSIYSYTNSVNYILVNKEEHIWSTLDWSFNVTPANMWKVDDNYYCYFGTKYYIFNKSEKTWNETESFNGIKDFNPRYIWTDGKEIYYSCNGDQFILDKETLNWIPYTWTGMSTSGFWGNCVWTDGVNYYYGTQFKLNHKAA